MTTEVKTILEQVNRAVEEMRSAEKQGREDLADKINGEITKLYGQMDEVKTAMARSQAVDTIKAQADEYKSAFTKFMRKGDVAALEAKALSTTADADGGYAVPEGLVREVGRILTETSPMRQVANVVTISTANYEKLYSNADAAAGWVSETAARTATNTPTLGQVIITPGEMYANAQVSQRVIDDAFFDVEGWLVSELSDKFSRLENDAFVNGDGTNKPKGILAHNYVSVAGTSEFNKVNYIETASVNALAADDIISLIYSLKAGYRAKGKFLMNRATLAKVRKLKDAVDGAYLWQPSLMAGEPSTLCGFPVYEMADFPTAVAVGSPVVEEPIIAFGDFQAGYTIVDRVGIRTLRDPYSNKPYIGFYSTKRVGGGLTDGHAFIVLKQKES